MKVQWNELSAAAKILLIVKIVASVCVIVFASLSMTGVWEDANYLTIPLLGVVNLIQSIQEWKQHRKLAIFGLCVVAFCIFVTIAVFFL